MELQSQDPTAHSVALEALPYHSEIYVFICSSLAVHYITCTVQQIYDTLHTDSTESVEF